jgi:hypothetical protein
MWVVFTHNYTLTGMLLNHVFPVKAPYYGYGAPAESSLPFFWWSFFAPEPIKRSFELGSQAWQARILATRLLAHRINLF